MSEARNRRLYWVSLNYINRLGQTCASCTVRATSVIDASAKARVVIEAADPDACGFALRFYESQRTINRTVSNQGEL